MKMIPGINTAENTRLLIMKRPMRISHGGNRRSAPSRNPMYQSGWENDVAEPVSYGPYSQMALTWNSAPITVITPATRNSSPVDLMANPGHTRTPMTLRSVRPGPVNCVCFWRHTSARCTARRATMRAGMSRMCTG